MVTARTLVTDALDLLMVHAAEEPLSAHQEQQGLRVLNDLIQSASLEHFLIYHTPAVVVDWPAGSRVQTWGPGGDIVATDRPVQLDTSATRYDPVAQVAFPLPVLPFATFYRLPYPEQIGDYMHALCYDTSYPLGVLYAYPIPRSRVQVTVYPWLILRSWEEFDTDVGMPPGYDRYLKAALACDLAPFYDKEASPTVQGMRMEARDRLKTVNLTIPELEVPWFADPYGQRGDVTPLTYWQR